MARDTLVLGAGVNGLTAACYLARSGDRVTVVSRHESRGGLVRRHEFHPGYHSPGAIYDTSMLRDWIVDDLGLRDHGLQTSVDSTRALIRDGRREIVLSADVDGSAESIERSEGAADAARYREFRAFVARIAGPIRRFVNEVPPDLVDPRTTDLRELFLRGWQLRRLGKSDMLEVLRLAPMTVYDWLDEWFGSDLLKAALALPAVTESYAAPWSPGTNANVLVRCVTSGAGVIGDGLALVAALEKSARSLGVTFRTAEVERIVPGEGLVLADGERLRADRIAASWDPKTVFLDYMNPADLEHRFEQRVVNFRSRGLTSQLLLALDTAPEFGVDVDKLRVVESLDGIEQSFDPVKYGRYPERPSLEVYSPSHRHPDLAPNGHAVLSVHVHYTPAELREVGGWTQDARADLTSLVLRRLEEVLPGIESSVVGHELLTPNDIERRYGVAGGHLYEGEHALDQWLVRPTPECSQYRTPFPGLFLCSGGSFPGGGLTGAPGALAARAMTR